MSEQTVLVSDCKERVAFDLMKQIAIAEATKLNRQQIITLYNQCLKAVHFNDPEDIFDKE